MAGTGPEVPRAGGPNDGGGAAQPAPPPTPDPAERGRVYRRTGWYDEPPTEPTPLPAAPPAPVLPTAKGPWALRRTDVTTSLTGDILGGRAQPPPPRGRTGQVVLFLAIGMLLLVLLGLVAVYLLSDAFEGITG